MLHHKKIVPFTLALLASVGVLAEPIRASQSPAFLIAQETTTESSFPLLDKLPQGSSVKISGSESIGNTGTSLVEKFESKYPGASVEFTSTTSDAALTAVQNNSADLAAIGRTLTDTEKAQGFKTVTLNREKIAIIVGAENPYNGNLTIEQFAKIFRGEITNWSEIGGTPGAIQLVDRLDTNDTRRSFPNYPVFQSAPFQAGSNATIPNQDNISAVVKELGSNGISYAPISLTKGLKGIKVVTMHKTLPDDPRYPFSQPNLYVYQGELSPAAQGYLGFVTANAKQGTVAQTPENNSSLTGTTTSEAQTRDPRFKIDAPEVKIPQPDFKVDAPDVKVPDVDVEAPNIDAKTPDVKAPSINNPDISAKVPGVNAPNIDAKTPDVDINTPDVKAPSINNPDISAKAPDVNAPNANTPNIDAPSIDIKTPSINNPDLNVNASGANTTGVDAKAPDVSTPNLNAQAAPNSNLNTPDGTVQAPKGKWLWWLPLLGIIPLIGFLVKNGKGREQETVTAPVRERELVGAGVGGGTTAFTDRNLDDGTNLAAGATVAGLGGAAIANRRRQPDLPDMPDLDIERNVDGVRNRLNDINTPDLPKFGDIGTDANGNLDKIQSRIDDLDTPELDTPDLPSLDDVTTNIGGSVEGFKSRIGDIAPDISTPDLPDVDVNNFQTNIGSTVNGIKGKVDDVSTNGSNFDLPELDDISLDIDGLDLPELNDVNADPNNFDLLGLDRPIANSQEFELLELDDLTENSHDLDLPDLDLANDDLRGLNSQVQNNLDDLDNLINSKPENSQKDNNFFDSLQEKANRAVNEATNAASELKDNLWDDSDR